VVIVLSGLAHTDCRRCGDSIADAGTIGEQMVENG
jgi:hypothetical protein